MIGTVVLCPRCETGHFTPYEDDKGAEQEPEARNEQLRRFPFPALSRVANIYICSPCGTDEAMRDFAQAAPIPPDEWPVAVSA